MRIGIFDNNTLKFAQVLKDHWEQKGHTVLFEPGYNPNLIETCDLVFFEMADTNIHLATRERPAKRGKVACRIIDVDALVNGPSGIQPGYVDDIFYIAPHIQAYCQKFENLRSSREHLIPMGVDLDRFTFRPIREDSKKIAFIATRLTPEKGFDKALSILTELLKEDEGWTLHVVGRMYENNAWELHIKHHIEANHLEDKVIFYGNLPYADGNEIDLFLQDKEFLLLCSYKEAFSFVTAEAMAKGIKPIVYAFNGSEAIWDGAKILYRTEKEAVDMFYSKDYDSHFLHDYVAEKYPLSKHLQAMDEALEIP